MPYLHPNRITPNKLESAWSRRRMILVLKKQGQIEPLQVWADGDYYRTFEQDAWGDDIVYAARALGWDSIQVHLTTKYEQ